MLSETGNVGGDPIALELACNKVIAMTNSLGEITEAYAEVAQQIQEALLIITNSVVDNTDDKTAMSDAHTKANKELEEALDVEVIKPSVMICPMLLMHLYWWLIRQMVHHLTILS
mgnify:CR=1 FL=1